MLKRLTHIQKMSFFNLPTAWKTEERFVFVAGSLRYCALAIQPIKIKKWLISLFSCLSEAIYFWGNSLVFLCSVVTLKFSGEILQIETSGVFKGRIRGARKTVITVFFISISSFFYMIDESWAAFISHFLLLMVFWLSSLDLTPLRIKTRFLLHPRA